MRQTGVEERNRKKRASELLRIIGGLGPAIIKAGQALSSRPDLLPKEYLDELQKLQVSHPYHHPPVPFERQMMKVFPCQRGNPRAQRAMRVITGNSVLLKKKILL